MEILCLMMMVYDRSLFVSGSQVEKAHNADLHCVDWNAHDQNLILTGYLLSLCFFWFIHLVVNLLNHLCFDDVFLLLEGNNEIETFLIHVIF